MRLAKASKIRTLENQVTELIFGWFVLVTFVGLMGVGFGVLFSESAYKFSVDFAPASPFIPATIYGFWWLSNRTKQLFTAATNIQSGANHASTV